MCLELGIRYITQRRTHVLEHKAQADENETLPGTERRP